MRKRAVRKAQDLTPGTPAGNEYLKAQAKERQRRGYHGFSRPGRMGDAAGTYGSTAQKSGVARKGGTKKLPMRTRKG